MTVFISCGKKKVPHKEVAEKLYTGIFFDSQLNYAKNLNPDYIFILSAKYGLVQLDDVLEPYELTLKNMGKSDRKQWADKVIIQLKGINFDFSQPVVFLAGEYYREFLTNYFVNYTAPLQGLPIGKQIQYMKGNYMKGNTVLNEKKY